MLILVAGLACSLITWGCILGRSKDRLSRAAGWLLILGAIPLAIWLGERVRLQIGLEAVKAYKIERRLNLIQP